eukprot:CAMPEP_0175714792 /NCGR_PEP_ID=MMETSP0097-20121207/42304_1 /TAXON_ID=311494 /ORGANISM="Alexandrium monilatum, Strain CCMP3105" /LENGTH=80 /DNA_ID=CAMNT_0017022301 /DNA_START=45 /DNA_END=284 /DNA_ORIENTATION=-
MSGGGGSAEGASNCAGGNEAEQPGVGGNVAEQPDGKGEDDGSKHPYVYEIETNLYGVLVIKGGLSQTIVFLVFVALALGI